jgi:hypothetical protein
MKKKEEEEREGDGYIGKGKPESNRNKIWRV